MSQVIPVVSEALQSTVRKLLPSQFGFGEDLQASNVIIPIIDLTASAEGSGINVSMQQALNFGGSTAFDITNTTTALAASPGFWRFSGTFSLNRKSTTVEVCQFAITDGATSKNVYAQSMDFGGGDGTSIATSFDVIIYLNAGESVNGIATGNAFVTGSYRQIASSTGELVNPVGFTVE